MLKEVRKECTWNIEELLWGASFQMENIEARLNKPALITIILSGSMKQYVLAANSFESTNAIKKASWCCVEKL